MIRRRIKKFLGFGTDLPRGAETFLDKQGDTRITSLRVYRAPISDVISKFLNVISLGTFRQLQQKVGYDKLFHLSLVVNGTTRIEKNEQIKISPYRDEKDEEFIDIPLKGQNITIKQLMDRGAIYMKDRFLPYDAFTNNCQDFIVGLLRASGLSSPTIEKFIKQPVDELVDGLPGYVKTTTNLITSLGGLLTYLREEFGLKEGGIIADNMPDVIKDIIKALSSSLEPE